MYSNRRYEAYIFKQGKKLGNKTFDSVDDAIQHRKYLEDLYGHDD